VADQGELPAVAWSGACTGRLAEATGTIMVRAALKLRDPTG